MDTYQVLVRPVITEKNTMLSEQGKYAFEVHPDANKIQIRQAVQTIFKVEVAKVNVMKVPGKTRRLGRHVGRTRAWKKAVVTLRPGQRIELFQGV
jgi:large subunit ribosomal protein L23